MKNHLCSTVFVALSLCTGHALAQTAPAAQPSPASAYPVAPAPGLYQAFGEEAGIKALMDDFVQRLRADARIGDQFKESNLENLSKSLANQLCQLSGGPCVYKGPDMKDVHTGMNIQRSHFNALVEVLQQAMDARGIPFQRQGQMLALLAPMHRDVVAQ